MNIKERAMIYGKEHPFAWPGRDGELNEDIYCPAVAYEDGANAVLREIEARIEMSKHASMQTAETILGAIEMTINELKKG